jgi:hypothetical protein
MHLFGPAGCSFNFVLPNRKSDLAIQNGTAVPTDRPLPSHGTRSRTNRVSESRRMNESKSNRAIRFKHTIIENDNENDNDF